MEYRLAPRKFPRIASFSVRVDSSLGSTVLPDGATDAVCSSALADAEASAVLVCSKVTRWRPGPAGWPRACTALHVSAAAAEQGQRQLISSVPATASALAL